MTCLARRFRLAAPLPSTYSAARALIGVACVVGVRPDVLVTRAVVEALDRVVCHTRARTQSRPRTCVPARAPPQAHRSPAAEAQARRLT